MERNLVHRISVLNVSNSLKQDRSEKPMSKFQSKPSDYDHQQKETPKKQETEQSQNITPDRINTPAKQDRNTPPLPEEDESSTNDKDVVDDDDDGFKTPTSLEHKIPPTTECPPAPGKPKPFLKRKVSSVAVASASGCSQKGSVYSSTNGYDIVANFFLSPDGSAKIKRARRSE